VIRCAVSQPAFLPWIGWFDIFDQADWMVLLDTVQFEKQSWQQRNRIPTASGLLTVTVPVTTKGRSKQQILDVELANSNFARKFLTTLQMNYSRAPHFKDVYGELEAILPALVATGRLSELNVGLIEWLARWLRVTTKTLRASECSAVGTRGEYVAQLCAAVGANEYLSTAGATEYLREDQPSFDRRGIRVLIHTYEHPEYPQLHQPFAPYASAIDLVMMLGSDSGEFLRANRGGWTELAATG
jgi:hypothetical protein